MKVLIIIIISLLTIALIVFLIKRNQKDEKEFEREINNNYTKANGEEGNIEIDELKKWVEIELVRLIRINN